MSRLTRILTSEWTKRIVVLFLTVIVAISIRDYFVQHKGWSKWAVTPVATAMYFLAFALYDWATSPWSWKAKLREIDRARAIERDEWAKAAFGAVSAMMETKETDERNRARIAQGDRGGAPAVSADGRPVERGPRFPPRSGRR